MEQMKMTYKVENEEKAYLKLIRYKFLKNNDFVPVDRR